MWMVLSMIIGDCNGARSVDQLLLLWGTTVDSIYRAGIFITPSF